MRSPRLLERNDETAGFVPILLANLVPLVGVVALEWDPETLVVIYGVELLLSLLLAGGTALFAQRPPPDRDGVVSASDALLTGKRGTLRPFESLPPIHVRNVPFALGVVVSVTLYAVVFGVIAYIGFQGEWTLESTAVLLSVSVLLVGQFLETRRQYFHGRRYERVSPYAVIETPARQVFALLFALAFVGVTVGLAIGSTAVLVIVVCVKLAVEWSAYRANRTDEDTNRFVDRFVAWFADPEPSDALDPVRAPTTPPETRVRPARTVVLEGLFVALLATAVYTIFFAGVWLFVVLVVVVWTGSVTVFWIGVVATVLLVIAVIAVQYIMYYLEYGTLEYQRRDDHLVAYDRFLAEPQWAVRIDEIRIATIEQDRLFDRLLGTRTIRVTAGWGSGKTDRLLGPVAEPDRVAEAFELPLETIALEPIDRRFAVGSVVMVVAGVLAGTVAFLAPDTLEEFEDGVLAGAFLLLFLASHLWHRAVPDG
ncbi:DUF6498-containing protein [Natronobacterium gregoryi]|uniref:Uncharacterized protein n=2 Tax=Natronobacterium gregoryi TaxID=44930 RepID=L0AG41_NATGS|nr:DUF6498-containing protein [Natronobacterium gregoryi]AFZ72898.1 hypothetical protein Natgr_1701 [Natronobacterium gregoryi SP2]PLK21873.1 hypothetical protein CYV19_01890 [Natronobacterium gregoryi SP2]SFI66753.1 hypothetical protein SAMN05443661_10366 [Natronobacterium gregoryi]